MAFLDDMLSIASLYLLYVLVVISLRGKKSGYLLVLGLLLILSLVAIIHAWSFVSDSTVVGPGFMPLICGVLLAVCSLIEIFKDIGRGLESSKQSPLVQFKTLFVGIFVLATYLLILPYLGYFVATGLFVACLTFCLGLKKLIPIAGLTFGWLLFVYVVFVKLLGVPLPEQAVF